MRTAYQNLSFCLYIIKTIIKIKNEDNFSNIADIYQNTTFCSGNESLLLKSLCACSGEDIAGLNLLYPLHYMGEHVTL